MKTVIVAAWLMLAVLCIAYVANNFIDLNRWIDAEMCFVRR